MRAEDALAMLKSDPLGLMAGAHIHIAGGGASSTSGFALFALGLPVAMQGTFRDASGADLPTVQLRHMTDSISAPKIKLGTDTYLTFGAYYVAMKRMATDGSAAPTGTYLTLSSTGACDLCITSLLTGCTFGIGSSTLDGTRLVSHIQPATSAANDRGTIATQTQSLFGTAPDLLVEKGVTYTDRATVIGHRLAGQWSFFIQEANGAAHTVSAPRVL